MSLGTSWMARHEYERSNLDQRGAFRGMISRLYGLTTDPFSNDDFVFQEQQLERVRAKLDLYVLLINLGALLIGGVGSYWFAGRTLRPIEVAHDAQKRFASDASHELRTPLTAMKLENEVFLRQKDFSKTEARALITSNVEEVDRLERLATNLLNLTHYETAQLTLLPTDITRIVADAKVQTKRAHPKVRIVVAAADAKVMVHPESAAQLLTIILDNACKYGAGGAVKFTGKRREGRYCVYIDDEGPGIPAADLPHIFERLYRSDKARSSSVPGHGLGLALAGRIAQANHAEIGAGNRKGGGARFTVSFLLPRRGMGPKATTD